MRACYSVFPTRFGRAQVLRFVQVRTSYGLRSSFEDLGNISMYGDGLDENSSTGLVFSDYFKSGEVFYLEEFIAVIKRARGASVSPTSATLPAIPVVYRAEVS